MINIISEIAGTSGYASHGRQLAKALFKQTKCRLTTSIPNGFHTELTDNEVEMIKRKSEEDEINLIITNPMHWKMHLGKRNWAYLVFEGDRIPKSWLDECRNDDIEYIIVPSKHVKDAILNSVNERTGDYDLKIPDKIKIVPHGVDLELFYPKNTLHKGSSHLTEHAEGAEGVKCDPPQFRFLCNKGFRHLEDRGGVQYALRAFIEEFTDEDVELVIKLNPAYGIPDLDKLVKEISPRTDKIPKITFYTDNVPYNKLNDLYNSCDVFVATTRGEAYNIPCIEAMACGLPVITTDFGGQTDFIDKENGWLIDYKLTEVTWEILYEGIKWATPKIMDIRVAMRSAYGNRDLVKQKSENALETAKKLTWDNSAKKIVKLI